MIKNEIEKQDSKEPCLLKQVGQQEIESAEFGFYWQNLHQIIEQIQSECAEVEEAFESGDTQHLQEEIGDLIQATICLTVFCKFDPHETLQKSIVKYQKRFDVLMQLAQADGHLSLHNQSFDVLMSYWNRAKIKTDPKNHS